MYGFVKFLLLIGLLIAQNRNDLTRPSLLGFQLNQKDIVYYSFNQIPGMDTLELMEFHFSIQKNIFVYEKNEDHFNANLEILLHFQADQYTETAIWKETIKAVEFSETESGDHFRLTKLIKIPPAKYKIQLKVTDTSSGKFRIFSGEIIVESSHAVQPYFSKLNFIKNGKFLVNQAAMDIRDSIDIVFYYRTEEEYDYTIRIIDIEQDIEFFRFNSKLFASPNKVTTKLTKTSMQRLGEGSYKIIYEFKNEINNDYREKEFRVIYWNKPETLYSAQLALRPFVVLLPDEEKLDFAERNVESQIEFFNQYWESKNLSKNMKYNVLQEEFFKRADYTVYNYSTKLKAGWDTDRGLTYLLYGKPEKVEKKFSDSGEFQIWFYNNFKKIFFKDNFEFDFNEVDTLKAD